MFPIFYRTFSTVIISLPLAYFANFFSLLLPFPYSSLSTVSTTLILPVYYLTSPYFLTPQLSSLATLPISYFPLTFTLILYCPSTIKLSLLGCFPLTPLLRKLSLIFHNSSPIFLSPSTFHHFATSNQLPSPSSFLPTFSFREKLQ